MTTPDFAEIDGHDPETATLLLSAAEDLDLESSVVRTTSTGFKVPIAVAEAAGVEFASEDEGLSFRTKADAEAYVAANEIDDSEFPSDAAGYKAATAAAAKGA